MMKPEQATKIPFESETYTVGSDENKHIVRRLPGIINGICPGMRLDQLIHSLTYYWNVVKLTTRLAFSNMFSAPNVRIISKAMTANT